MGRDANRVRYMILNTLSIYQIQKCQCIGLPLDFTFTLQFDWQFSFYGLFGVAFILLFYIYLNLFILHSVQSHDRVY